MDLTRLKSYDRDFVNDVALLPYSSGTTGLSKGVQLSHRNIVSNSHMVNEEFDGIAISNAAIGNHQDILPCVLPFFHIYGFTVCLMSKLAHGAKLVTLPKFTPELYLNALDKYPASVLYLVPPISKYFLNFFIKIIKLFLLSVIFLTHFDKVKEKHVKSIKYVMSGAAPIGKSDAERFIKKAPNAKFFQGYGLTEVCFN